MTDSNNGSNGSAHGAVRGEDKVRVAISTDGKTKRDQIVRTRGIDRYHWPLGVALGILLVEPLLRTRARNRRAALTP